MTGSAVPLAPRPTTPFPSAPKLATRDFYDGLKRTKRGREESRIFHLRCLNNYVKARLLEDATKSLTEVRALDLACGKGADYKKFPRLARYLGLDFASKSLDEARARVAVNKGSAAEFVATDLRADDVWARRRPETFNVASCQFALHYFFESESSARRLFATAGARLETGAKFVATTVSPEALYEAWVESSGKFVVRDGCEREILRIEFDHAPTTPGFGVRYRFALSDEEDLKAVDAPEFVVFTSTLRKVASEAGFRLDERLPLRDFAVRNPDKDLWRRMSVSNADGTVSEAEWRVAGLYQILVFTKT